MINTGIAAPDRDTRIATWTANPRVQGRKQHVSVEKMGEIMPRPA